jgi:Amt family ammonium transporter
VHLLGAAVTLAGILVFLPRVPKLSASDEGMPLPPVHLPLLAVLGCGLLLAGGLAWTVSNPLLTLSPSDLPLLGLNTILAAAAAAFLPLFYTWFVAGRTDPLMAARGFAAGVVAIAAGAPFMPPWATLALGAAIGLITVFVIFIMDHLLRWDDPTAALTVHGLAGGLGLLAVGIFADGRAGAGWNGVGAITYLGVPGQGVTGLFAARGFQPDWPGQMAAQLVGMAALTLLGFFASWLFTAPLSLLFHLLGPQSASLASVPEGRPASSTETLQESKHPPDAEVTEAPYTSGTSAAKGQEPEDRASPDDELPPPTALRDSVPEM